MNPTHLCQSLRFVIYSNIMGKRSNTSVAIFADETILTLCAESSNTLEIVGMKNCWGREYQQVQKRVRQTQGQYIAKSTGELTRQCHVIT